MIDSIIILVAVLLGYFIRDLRAKKVIKGAHRVKQGVRILGKTGKGEVLVYKPPKDKDKVAEKEVRENVETI